MRDVKNQPHYTQFKVQPIEFIRANAAVLDPLQANIIKYVCRFRMKDGLRDLDKAADYLRMLREDFLTMLEEIETPAGPEIMPDYDGYQTGAVGDIVEANKAALEHEKRIAKEFEAKFKEAAREDFEKMVNYPDEVVVPAIPTRPIPPPHYVGFEDRSNVDACGEGCSVCYPSPEPMLGDLQGCATSTPPRQHELQSLGPVLGKIPRDAIEEGKFPKCPMCGETEPCGVVHTIKSDSRPLGSTKTLYTLMAPSAQGRRRFLWSVPPSGPVAYEVPGWWWASHKDAKLFWDSNQPALKEFSIVGKDFVNSLLHGEESL